MIALGILLAIAFLIAVAAGVAHIAFRWMHSRWAQVGVFVLVLWLPFWNVIPGWIAYHNAVREIGGRRIYQVVQAEGYLNLHSTDRARPWLGLKGSPFRYIEIERTHPGWDTFRALEQRPGFYEYRLFKRGATECRATETIANIDELFDSFGLRGLCVSSTWRSSPISRYTWDGGGWEPLPGSAFLACCQAATSRARPS